jgi:hypothetical protein
LNDICYCKKQIAVNAEQEETDEAFRAKDFGAGLKAARYRKRCHANWPSGGAPGSEPQRNVLEANRPGGVIAASETGSA